MAFAVQVSPGARQDASIAFRWYRDKSANAATAFRAEVLAAFQLIAQDPYRWTQLDGGVRRFVMKRFPYTAYFEIDGSVIRILALGHHRRQPNYWVGR